MIRVKKTCRIYVDPRTGHKSNVCVPDTPNKSCMVYWNIYTGGDRIMCGPLTRKYPLPKVVPDNLQAVGIRRKNLPGALVVRASD